MDYEKLHKDTITKLQEMVNSGKITVETACGICADFVPESEDERIRKRIIQALHGDALEMSEIKEIRAWLEKQGEHAKFCNKIQIGDKVTRNEDGVLVNLSQLKRVAKRDEKQGEQKPVTNNDDYPKLSSSTLTSWMAGRCASRSDYTIKDMIAWIRQYKSVEWSKNDELMVNGLLKYFISIKDTSESEKFFDLGVDNLINWLKSLKDRVLPQPKNEWSEEDEENMNHLIESLSHANPWEYLSNKGYHKTILVPWLKSLRLQNTWKPSDEQMKALDSAIHCYAGISPTNNREVYALEIMKEQLKKLREE